MLYLKSLVCHGCKRFFTTRTRKPCIGLCGHSVCLECVNQKCEMSCPICKLERQFVDKIINYASLNMVEEIDDKPVDTLRKWWNGQNFGSGVCPECSSYTENLRICLKCENEQPVKRMANLGVLWHAVCKNSLPPSSIVMCATCAIENHDHDGYKPKKLKEVEMCEDKEAHHLVSNIHYLSTDLVEILCDNVWNNLESTKGANCKLRWMRMMRTCEVAMHLAKVQAKVIFSKANEILSEFSRFFKPLYDVEDEYEYEKDPELINRLIDSLEVQWNTFKADISKTESTIECECTALWKQMAKLKLNNAADQSFAEIVMNTSLEANISGCLLHLDTSSHLLNQLMEFGSKQFSNLNIHLLPSVFCWGTESTCGVIYDFTEFCTGCGKSQCAQCSSYRRLCLPHCMKEKNFDNEYHAETVRLALYFRKHCIEVFEEWWRSELPPEQGFCPSCNSFSTEIVVYHESTDEMCRKNYSILNKDPTGGLMFRFFDPTLFYSKRLCSQCSNVLRNFFQHRYCMVREIGKADVMTKYAMMHMIMRILRDAVEEIADTKELRNILNNLEQYLKSYLKSVYNDEKSEIISRYFDAVEEIFEHFKRELTGLRREFHDRKYYNGFVTE